MLNLVLAASMHVAKLCSLQINIYDLNSVDDCAISLNRKAK